MIWDKLNKDYIFDKVYMLSEQAQEPNSTSAHEFNN